MTPARGFKDFLGPRVPEDAPKKAMEEFKAASEPYEVVRAFIKCARITRGNDVKKVFFYSLLSLADDSIGTAKSYLLTAAQACERALTSRADPPVASGSAVPHVIGLLQASSYERRDPKREELFASLPGEKDEVYCEKCDQSEHMCECE
jgi:hypothetical protein